MNSNEFNMLVCTLSTQGSRIKLSQNLCFLSGMNPMISSRKSVFDSLSDEVRTARSALAEEAEGEAASVHTRFA